MRKLAFIPLGAVALSKSVAAHCPLCTAGAAAAAAGALWLGVAKPVVSLFIGAFAFALGLWIASMLKKTYVPHQALLIGIASYLVTVLPLMGLFAYPLPWYLSLTGEYGSLLNRTYVFDLSLLTSILGAVIVWIAPWLSRRLTAWRGRTMPYQGVLITFGLLLIIGVLIQLAV